MIRVDVEFHDHTDRAMLEIRGRLSQLCADGALTLREEYHRRLTRKIAKPHSRPGQIPYAYNGPAPGQESAYEEPGVKNNRVETGFARDQTTYLADYLETDGGYIGFSRSGHVANRSQNYLIGWDGEDRSFTGIPGNRPWIGKVYRQSRAKMIAGMQSLLRSGKLGQKSDDVPF